MALREMISIMIMRVPQSCGSTLDRTHAFSLRYSCSLPAELQLRNITTKFLFFYFFKKIATQKTRARKGACILTHTVMPLTINWHLSLISILYANSNALLFECPTTSALDKLVLLYFKALKNPFQIKIYEAYTFFLLLYKGLGNKEPSARIGEEPTKNQTLATE